MQINSVGGQSYPLANQVQPMRSEESGEASSGPAEETREKGSIAKSAELARGIGTSVDLLA